MVEILKFPKRIVKFEKEAGKIRKWLLDKLMSKIKLVTVSIDISLWLVTWEQRVLCILPKIRLCHDHDTGNFITGCCSDWVVEFENGF